MLKFFQGFKQDIDDAKTPQEMQAVLLAMSRFFCKNMLVSGQLGVLPARQRDHVTLLLSNHVSSMDHWLITSLLPERQDYLFSAFTYEVMRYVPVFGGLVGKVLIGLRKEEPVEELRRKIVWFLDKGYNTFLLFPEGSLLYESAFESSLRWQRKKNVKPLMKHVLYPRHKALAAFCELVGDRLRHVVDFTLFYPGMGKTVNKVWVGYPHASHALFHEIPAPRVHIDWTVVGPGEARVVGSEQWLEALWQKKEAQIRQWKRDLQAPHA